ncbi:MAG: hypothetical protein ACMG6E_06900 [Candidatus Roizmanbacteria bacterium]
MIIYLDLLGQKARTFELEDDLVINVCGDKKATFFSTSNNYYIDVLTLSLIEVKSAEDDKITGTRTELKPETTGLNFN